MIASLLQWIDTFRRRDKTGAVLVFLMVTLLATAIATLAVDKFGPLTTADRFLQDFEVATLGPVQVQDPDITIVAITEQTLSQFPYRSPVDHAFVSDLLKDLDAKHPRAIGVDLLFDQATEPQKDAELEHTLQTLKTSLVVGYTDTPGVVDDSQLAYLNRFVPARLRAYVNIGTDQTDTARWVYPGGRTRSGTYLASFPRAVAAKIGVSSPPKRVPILWAGRPDPHVSTFAELPAESMKFLPASVIANRIVLIGSDITLIDHHRTPFAIVPGDQGMLPGVVIQAHALAQLIHHTPSPYVGTFGNLLITLLLAALGAGLGMSSRHVMLRATGGLLVLAAFWYAGGYLFDRAGIMIELIAPTLAAAGSFWAMDGLAGSEAREQREFIKGAMSSYVSPKLVDQLMRDPLKLSLGGERRVMSYIFTDVKDFTTMSEGLDPKELPRILNAYLDGITQIVFKYDGTVDKFIGDAVFAIFNAPLDQPDHGERAVHCALAIDRFCDGFHRERKAEGINFGLTRIGVHTGPAVIGNFGSHQKRNYTAQGDAVNTASRLEGLNKHLGTRICVSDAARELCPTTEFRPVASVVLKGKTLALDVFEPVHGERDEEFLTRYRAAYAKLAANAPEAFELFETLERSHPDDPCVKLHMERLRQGETGVAISMTEK